MLYSTFYKHYYYRELEGAVSVDSDNKDPLLTDVNKKFITCMEQFQKSTKVCVFVCACVCVCVCRVTSCDVT